MRSASQGAIAMNVTKLLTIAVMGSLLVGGVAAVGAATPNADTTQATETTPDAFEDVSATAELSEGDDHTGAAADRPGSVGPSDGLPGAVPDHVHAIHDRIESFLTGSIESLGASLNDLLSGGDDPADNGGSSQSNRV